MLCEFSNMIYYYFFVLLLFNCYNMSEHPNYPPQVFNDNAAPGQQYRYPEVEWIPTTPQQASSLRHCAVVGGYEGNGSPLWVIRARYQGELLPGKLGTQDQVAYVPWGGYEHEVRDIEVCCSRPNSIRWRESRDGLIPPNGIVAGHTSSGEQLYVGKVREHGTLTPGKVQPSEHVLYISFNGKEIKHKYYETMCYNYTT